MVNEVEKIKQCINVISELIDENNRDIGDDKTSDYARLRIRQNIELHKAIFYLESIYDPTHGYQE